MGKRWDESELEFHNFDFINYFDKTPTGTFSLLLTSANQTVCGKSCMAWNHMLSKILNRFLMLWESTSMSIVGTFSVYSEIHHSIDVKLRNPSTYKHVAAPAAEPLERHLTWAVRRFHLSVDPSPDCGDISIVGNFNIYPIPLIHSLPDSQASSRTHFKPDWAVNG